MNISPEDKRELFRIAKESVRAAVLRQAPPGFKPESKILETKSGAFVTLTKRGALRGCIGCIEPVKPLYKVVQEMAVSAALHDPRFPEVSQDELDEIKYEISILGELRKVNDIMEIKVGEHGILLKNGPYQGLLLPQVAREMNWDRETFLAHTCMKAGMPPQCWSDPNTEIFVFTAQVLEEE